MATVFVGHQGRVTKKPRKKRDKEGVKVNTARSDATHFAYWRHHSQNLL